MSLLAADGSEARRIAKGQFEAKGDRSFFFTMLMLMALSMVTIGNGFFKPNISTIVGTLYEQGDRRRDAGFTIFYMGINLGSLISQFFCPILVRAGRPVGRLRPRRGRHAFLLGADPVRWRPARRLWRPSGGRRPPTRT